MPAFGAGLPSGKFETGYMPETVSCLTRRVCFSGFERYELRKHSYVGLQPVHNVVPRNKPLSTHPGQHELLQAPPFMEGQLTTVVVICCKVLWNCSSNGIIPDRFSRACDWRLMSRNSLRCIRDQPAAWRFIFGIFFQCLSERFTKPEPGSHQP